MDDQLILECRHVCVGYGAKPVLRDIDVAVARGEVVALLGGSGSGKSTVLKSMVGLLPPLEGTVCMFGQDLYALSPRERAPLLLQPRIV